MTNVVNTCNYFTTTISLESSKTTKTCLKYVYNERITVKTYH